MDPDEIFKRFFGMSFPEIGHREFRRVDEDGSSRCEEFHHHGSDLFGDLHLRLQEQMEEMDKQMQKTFRLFSIPNHMPSGESTEGGPQPGCSARDQMLKEGERSPRPPQSSEQPSHERGLGPTHPSQSFSFSGGFFSPWFKGFAGTPRLNRIPALERRDHDIDQENPSRDDIVDIYQQTKEPSGWSFGAGRRMNVKTVIGADGVVEERVCIKDSSGREETTVRRRMGDRSHTVTTITDEKGQEERSEVFENIDKDKMSEFDQHWQGKGQCVDPVITNPSSAVQIPTAPGGTLSDTRGFFRKLFGF